MIESVQTHDRGDPALLHVSDLRVAFGRPGARKEAVRGISFDLFPGRCLAIVGESGSGKSVTARALVGLSGNSADVSAAALEFDSTDLRNASDSDWRKVRGREIGFVLQDALVSLDPLRSVGSEIEETMSVHRWKSRPERRARALNLMKQVAIPQPEIRINQRAHQLSGGQRQRALIASALSLNPRVVIADEPTTALDATVQEQILGLLDQITEQGRAVLMISHDLSAVARIADDIAVMRDGTIVEQGPTAQIIDEPRHEYTKSLLAAIPTGRSATRTVQATADQVPALEGRGLIKRFKGPSSTRTTAVDGVDFVLRNGTTLGVVGESGSGKTTTARLALALERPDAGEVLLHGEAWTSATRSELRRKRRQVGVVYQDPLSSFDPRWNVEQVIEDAVPESYGGRAARSSRVDELLVDVGLTREHRVRRPIELSGGQRQRVAIARALAGEPSVLVCDEPVSALDVSIQAQILDLLTSIQAATGISILFISHDLGVVHYMSDDIVVMKDGRVVEHGSASAVFENPQDDYTKKLFAAAPRIGSRLSTAGR